MNLPLYSPMAPSTGRKPIGAVGTGGPLPQHPVGVLYGSAMQAKGVFPFRFGGSRTAPAA